MKREKIILIIFSIITSIFGVISLFSALIMTFYESGTKEIKFWFFIGLTSFLLMILMIPVGALLNRKFPLNESDIKPKKVKTPLKKFDYFILFLLFSGIIIEGVIIIGLAYAMFFISFEKIEKITIFDIPLTFILHLLVYIGIGMLLAGFILPLIIDLKKDKNRKAIAES